MPRFRVTGPARALLVKPAVPPTASDWHYCRDPDHHHCRDPDHQHVTMMTTTRDAPGRPGPGRQPEALIMMIISRPHFAFRFAIQLRLVQSQSQSQAATEDSITVDGPHRRRLKSRRGVIDSLKRSDVCATGVC